MLSLEEVEFFIQSITDLQQNVDRAESQMQRLMIKKNLIA